ncbi:MAG: polymer-forming cytoskeletal protein [Vallitaleaceae bacterium]|nr:polymer-forming cytoskeletal protein [Vallitaleaceae bacterium]
MMGKKDKAAYDRPTTVICKDTKVEAGKLTSKSNVQISGHFLGDLDISASLVIGETGYVKGNIKSEYILLAGEVAGNIDVKHQLHITQTAKVKGDVIAGTVIIDEGAHLEGGIKMRDSGAQVNQDKSSEEENKVEIKSEPRKSSGVSSMFD